MFIAVIILSRLSFIQDADEELNKMLEEQKLISETYEPEVNLDNIIQPVEGDLVE